MAQRTFIGEHPIFDVYVYPKSHLLYGRYVNMIKYHFPEADTSLCDENTKDCIQVCFHGFVAYEKAKEIMYWFYDKFGTEETDGWGCNWEMDVKLDDVKNDWQRDNDNKK